LSLFVSSSYVSSFCVSLFPLLRLILVRLFLLRLLVSSFASPSFLAYLYSFESPFLVYFLLCVSSSCLFSSLVSFFCVSFFCVFFLRIPLFRLLLHQFQHLYFNKTDSYLFYPFNFYNSKKFISFSSGDINVLLNFLEFPFFLLHIDILPNNTSFNRFLNHFFFKAEKQ